MTGTSIGVIGAGAWGTALAQVAANAQAGSGAVVRLWLRDEAAAIEINRTHANESKLPGVRLSPAILATSKMRDMAGCAIILLAVPAQTVRSVTQALAPHLAPGVRLVITAKGFERGTAAMMTDVIAVTCPAAEPLVLSGPSFADDVVRGLPTAVTLAARTLEIAGAVAAEISVPTFRLYLSDDLVGVQVGGAVKNVLAIACGIVAGRRLGDSARSALIARAFAELNSDRPGDGRARGDARRPFGARRSGADLLKFAVTQLSAGRGSGRRPQPERNPGHAARH